jgi:hypothetical protein
MIAILIRGHSRNYQHVYQNFYDNIMKYKSSENVKIFIHTWTTTNYDNTSPVNKENIVELYQPESIMVEDQKSVILRNANKAKFAYQLYSMHKLKNLVRQYEQKNNCKFDAFIHTRFDMVYFKSLPEFLNLSKTHDIATFEKSIYYDLFAVLNKKSFEIYSNMYTMNFKKIKKIYNSYGINPIIQHIIKIYNFKHYKGRLAYLSRA